MVLNVPLMSRPAPHSTGGDPLKRILSALQHTPIPTAPPPHDSYQEALGLNLLTLALHLEHIDRISETLTLADSTHMARSVTVEIDMNVLTAEQKRAIRSDPTSDPDAPPAAVWIPVARQSRWDMAPVVVRNAAGEVVTRTTQVKTADALIHGMSKAFRMLLASDPRTEDPQAPLHNIRHRLNQSRWLIEATIANMIDAGLQYPIPVPDNHTEDHADGSDSIRNGAVTAIEHLFTAESPFLRLLDIASSEYILVVEVPTDKPRVFLRYDAPTMPARELRARATVTRWAALQQEFTVRYSTVIPRAVNSYHVTVEVPPEIQVRRFFLTSNVDKPALDTLIEDMRSVSGNYEQLWKQSPKLLELELQSIASRLAEFGRRRYRDLESFRYYITDCYAKFSHGAPRFRARRPPGQPVTRDGRLFPERPIVSWLVHFSHLYERDRFRHLTGGLLPASVLDWLASELETAELHADIYVDNDPRENAGHAQWQRRPFGTDPEPEEPVDTTVYIALVDDPPSLASNVSKLLLAVVLMVVGFGVVLQPDLFRNVPLLGFVSDRLHPATDDKPMSSADAIVTMLLLVPGIMLSRLDIPSTKTVLGLLRLLPRYVAYASVVTAGGLALLVASARAETLKGPIVIAMCALLVQALLMAADAFTKARKRRAPVPMSQVSPQWLVSEIRTRRGRRRKCSAAFSTVGRNDHD